MPKTICVINMNPNNALVIERRFWQPSGAFRREDAAPGWRIFLHAWSPGEAGCAVLMR